MELKTINTLDKKAQDNQNPADERDLHPYKKFINFRPKRVVRNNFLAFISGVLLAFSMPGHNLSFLAWVGFIPLLTLIDKSYTYKDSFIASLCFGFGFNMLVLNWICGLHPLTWMGITSTQSILLALTVWISVSAFCSVSTGFFGIITKFIFQTHLSSVIKSLLISCSWIFTSNIVMTYFMGAFSFPWTMIEYSQYKNLPLLQYAQFIDGIGLGFFIMFINAILATWVGFKSGKNSIKLNKTKLLIIISTIIIVHAGGHLLLKTNKTTDPDFKATIIQSNVHIEDEKGRINSLKNVKRFYYKLFYNAPEGLIIVPETAIVDYIRFQDKKFYSDLINLAATQNKTLIVGTLDSNKKGDVIYPTNSVITFDKAIKNPEKYIYDKHYLVPFGEFFPFYDIWPDKIQRLACKCVDYDFLPGKTIQSVPTSIGNIAPSICYEIIFPNLIKKQVQKGADILVNLSNLAWFHDTKIKDQFIAFGVMRASEVRKPFIIAINTGKSVFISSNGKILQVIPKNSFYTQSLDFNPNLKQ